jgi:hypothetical protein
VQPYPQPVQPYPQPVQAAPYPGQQPYPQSAPYPGQPGQPYPAPPNPSSLPFPAGPSAGGLTAPKPLDPNAAQNGNTTEQALDEAKDEDSGRGLSFFYIDVEGGYQFLSLETFDVDEASLTAGFIEKDAHGGFIGAGLGLQLLYFTLGPRVRWGFFPDYQLFSVGGELGARIPIGVIEPHFGLGAGYTAVGNLSDALHAIPEAISIDGAITRP